jgi:hypothetical protein
LPSVEGKIDMGARRQVTNKLRGQYRRASKADRGKILDRVVETTGMGRSDDQGPVRRRKHADQVDRRGRRRPARPAVVPVRAAPRLAAVVTGLTLPYNSGAVEGTVNRIKQLKAAMYGRAKPDLLRKLILLA